MPSTEYSLILGAVSNLPFDAFSPFFTSLRQAGYRGSVVLFTRNLDAQTSRQLARHARLIDADSYYGTLGIFGGVYSRLLLMGRRRAPKSHLFRMLDSCLRAATRITVSTHRARFCRYQRHLNDLMFLRFFLYSDFLLQAEKSGERFDQVLLTDVRDVLFQADPFLEPDQQELNVYLEAQDVRVGRHGRNHDWITQLYDTQTADSLRDCVVSCAGTTLGTAAGIRRYLICLTKELLRMNKYVIGQDQAAHNLLIYRGAFDPVHISPNLQGSVATLGLERDIQLRDGAIVGANDRRIPILHQYDRHNELSRSLLNRFASSPEPEVVASP
jgi:hypothetical protein